jgi:alkanesulfonate monooxygenase SsuD/methylene tetrahydromethanopterin reductase-like flavin-dependent oxidoreductase (luciferase family)
VHYQLAETICRPRPIQAPRPPILVGGSGEQKTLRLVARYADACNLFGTDVDTVRHKLEVLDGHCETEGRDPSTVRRTMIAGATGDADAFVRAMEPYAALGIEQVWVSATSDDPAGWVDAFTHAVVPRLAEL